MSMTSSSSTFLSPSRSSSCSSSVTWEPFHRWSSTSLRNPLNTNTTQQGKLILFSTLSFSTRNSRECRLSERPIYCFIDENVRTPTKCKQQEAVEEETHVLIHGENGGGEPRGRNLGVDAPALFLVEESDDETPTGNNYETLKEKVEILVGSSNKSIGTLGVAEFSERMTSLVDAKRFEKFYVFERDEGFSTNEDFNTLLMVMAQADELELAVNMFREFRSHGFVPDSRTFSIMIRCYCKRNEPEEAKRILDQMMEKGYCPNVGTFTILINSFCKRGKVQKSIEIFEVMGLNGCEPTIQTYNCLISGLCYVGRIEEAYELLMRIRKSPKRPDIYTYTAVMNGFCKVGRSDEAMELLQEAVTQGLEPTAVTFNTLFDGYCKEGRPMDGMNLLKQMTGRNCQPDYICYNTLLHGLLKWKELGTALQVYNEMLENGLQVDERIMNTLLRAVCRRSWTDRKLLVDIEEIHERIKKAGYTPYPNTYGLVIQALCIGGETEKGLAHLQEMTRLGHWPRLVTFNAVICALCRKGMIDEAVLVFVLMMNGDILPSRISYNLLIDELNHRDRVFDACKVYGIALKRGSLRHQKPGKCRKNENELPEDV